MPGAGTKTAITTAKPAARCLDLTRLVSRAGQGPATGVDRVELAYLRHLLDDPVPLFLLIGTSLGYLLLDEAGARGISLRLAGVQAWGSVDLVGRLARKAPALRRRAEADLRRMAIGRSLKGGLSAMLRRYLPDGTAYLNVGHSNLSGRTLQAVRSLPQSRITALIHDTIPLDYPHFQRPGTPEKFAGKLRNVARYADLVVYNSAQSRSDAERWISPNGQVPPGIVAHLGIDPVPPDDAQVPPDLDLHHPYFVTLGTIEPRKNHALLIDLWEALAADLPDRDLPNLLILGARGWCNEELFRRLDTSRLTERRIFERAGVADAAVSALISHSAGLLCPSLAEGFGLPPVEAAALNIPVICVDLPVYREILGNIPVYLKSDDVYSWRQSIIRLTKEKRAERRRGNGATSRFSIPTWADHFNLVLKVT